MAKYEKLTLKVFKDRLDNGEYANAGGAKKAIGKVQGWTNADRERAKGFIAKYFGESEEAPKVGKKKVAKKAATKKAPQKAAAASATKKVRKTKTTARRADGTVAVGAAGDHVGFDGSTYGRAMSQQTGETLDEIHVLGETINTAKLALDAMDLALKAGGAAINVSEGAAEAQKVLTNAMHRLNMLMSPPQPASNGQASTLPKEELRTESAPQQEAVVAAEA